MRWYRERELLCIHSVCGGRVCLCQGQREQNQLSHLYLILAFRLPRNYMHVSLPLVVFSDTGFCHCFLHIVLVTSLAGDTLNIATLQ